MKIIASNFKTNHTRKSAQEFITKLDESLSQDSNNRVFVFPPNTALLDNNFKNITIGSQNAYPVESGSVTGEIGLNQLQEFNINTILIGHSERREILKESQEMCIEKFDFFKEHGFTIIYCIGENLKTKENGLDSTLRFLESELLGIDITYDKLIIAYEPIWAIGTGVSATCSDIENVHTNLKQKLGKIPLLYGGSVKPNNTKDILRISGVDGILVGSASWELGSFCKILENSKEC